MTTKNLRTSQPEFKAELSARAESQVTNAPIETIYAAIRFLYDLRGNSFATDSEYETMLNDSVYARETLFGLVSYGTYIELLHGFLSGRSIGSGKVGSCDDCGHARLTRSIQCIRNDHDDCIGCDCICHMVECYVCDAKEFINGEITMSTLEDSGWYFGESGTLCPEHSEQEASE